MGYLMNKYLLTVTLRRTKAEDRSTHRKSAIPSVTRIRFLVISLMFIVFIVGARQGGEMAQLWYLHLFIISSSIIMPSVSMHLNEGTKNKQPNKKQSG